MLRVTPASGPPPRQRHRRPLTLVAVAAVALLAGAGVAALATSGSSSPATADSAAGQASPAPSASAPARSPDPRGPGARAPGGGGFFGGGFSAAPVHGTLVVPASGGGYETEDIQRGKVTAISSSSVTVVSTDKYAKTYRVTGSTSVNAGNGGLGTVKAGDQVSVTATVHGSTATVSSIIDLSRLGHGSFGPGSGSQGQPSS
jgi:hypothetical protein